jgi:hypothetical protein
VNLRRILAGSAVLLGANVAAGLGHYYFQVRGAAQLDAAAYGALNVWMAVLSIALLLAVLAQFAANFRPRTGAALRRTALIALGVTAACAAVASLGTREAFFVAAVVAGALLGYLVGHFQAFTRFGWMGLVVLSGAVLKVGVTFLDVADRYYVAFPVASIGACALGALALLVAGKDEPAPLSGAAQAIGPTVVLALATTLMPQIDLLNLRSAHDDVVLGQFARASLFAKALYFGALTLLQVTLPFHVRLARGQADEATARKVRLLERAGLAACAALSLSFIWVAPPMARLALGVDLAGEQRWWVVLACLCLTALYAHLGRIQVDCALGRPLLALRRVALIALTLPVFAVAPLPSVTAYLAVALAWYVVVLALLARSTVET